MTKTYALPREVEDFIPHRLPMRLVDRLLKADLGGAVVEVHPRAEHIMADADGVLHGAALLEMIAQSFAAMRGYLMAISGEAPRVGYLVGARNFKALGPVRSTDRLLVTVKPAGSIDAFHMAEAEISRDGEVVASGSVRVWTMPSGQPEAV